MAGRQRSSRLQRELKQKRSFASDAQEAAVAVMRTADVLKRHMSVVIERYGVTLQQYNVLRILRGAYPEPLPTLEIAERLIERMPGITRLLDRLADKGLVFRERDGDDRRQVNCWITPAGLELLEEMDDPVLAADEAFLKPMSRPQVRTLIQLLERVRSTDLG